MQRNENQITKSQQLDGYTISVWRNNRKVFSEKGLTREARDEIAKRYE